MLQTTPSGPSLGALSLDTPAKGGGTNSDEFLQEFDNQVKSIESAGRNEAQPDGATASAEVSGETEEKPEQVAEGEVTAQAETEEGESLAASEGEQGGNLLPLEQMRKMAAEVEVTGTQVQQPPVAAEAEADPALGAEVAPQLEEGRPDELMASAGEGTEEVASANEASVEAEPIAVASGAAPRGAATQASSTPVAEERGDEALSLSRPRGQEGAPATLLGRLPAEGRAPAAQARGDAAFESQLNNLTTRPTAAAFPIDTPTSTLTPLPALGVGAPLSSPAPIAMSLAVPLQQGNWGEAMAERVVWMTRANIQQAEIQLNPRDLGPIHIKVSLEHDQASVSFVAQHAATREALESALPRLREMLSDHGLQLGHSDVSQHGFKGGEGHADSGSGRAASLGGTETVEGDEALSGMESASGVSHVAPSGVDAFA